MILLFLDTTCYTASYLLEVSMASEIRAACSAYHRRVELFVEKHFVKIAFAVSAFALVTFAPLEFLLGTVAGYAANYVAKPSIHLNDQLVTATNTLFAIMGAVGMLVRYTPGGALGGFLFQAIPTLGSLSIGATLYRLHQLYKPPATPPAVPSAPPGGL